MKPCFSTIAYSFIFKPLLPLVRVTRQHDFKKLLSVLQSSNQYPLKEGRSCNDGIMAFLQTSGAFSRMCGQRVLFRQPFLGHFEQMAEPPLPRLLFRRFAWRSPLRILACTSALWTSLTTPSLPLLQKQWKMVRQNLTQFGYDNLSQQCLCFSGVASPKFWGAKYYDFKRATLFCLENLLSKHKTIRYTRNLMGMAPWPLAIVQLKEWKIDWHREIHWSCFFFI